MFKPVILLTNISIFIIISKEYLFRLIMCYLFDPDLKKKTFPHDLRPLKGLEVAQGYLLSMHALFICLVTSMIFKDYQ